MVSSSRVEKVEMESNDWILDLFWRWNRQDLLMDWMRCIREKEKSKMIPRLLALAKRVNRNAEIWDAGG